MKKLYTIIMAIVFTITLQAQNKLLSSVNEYYDGNNWQNSWGYNYEYDGNNNLISETYMDWENGEWKVVEKVTYTYNVDNKVIGELGQKWNLSTNMFENSYRDTYSYVDGKFSGQIGEFWENSSWNNEWKIDITNGINGFPTSYLSYDGSGLQWDLADQGTFSYNASNKVTEEVSKKWVNATWVNSYKTLYTYNANNKILNSRDANWDIFNSLWVATSDRMDYVVDVTGNRTSDVEGYFSNNSQYEYKNEYTYDTSSFMSNYAHPFKDKNGVDYLTEDFPYVNKILSKTQSYLNQETNTYTINSRTTYNYNSSITLSTEQVEIVNVGVSVYPNPTTSVLNIDCPNSLTISKIKIMDVTGKTVLVQVGDVKQINVDNLISGLYIVNLYSENGNTTIKFVKK